MSEVKFSRGPWDVEDYIDASGRCRISGEGWVGLAKVVVRMDGQKNLDSTGIANAHLIAAAPELYEALERLVSRIMEMELYELDGEVTEAESALAKSRGETLCE